MTYDEILRYISGMQATPVDYANAFSYNPNATTPTDETAGLRNIAWGNVPGLEQFYNYDILNNQENFNLREAIPEMQQRGYQVMQGFDPAAETSASWVAGPDGKPIAESARLTGMNDDAFKLAALAAMGVTGANVLGAGFGASGLGEATGATGATGGTGTLADLFPELMAPGTAGGVPAMAMPAEAAQIGSLLAGIPTTAEVLNGLPALSSLGGAASAATQTAPAASGLGSLLNNDLVKAGIIAAGAAGGAQPSGGETITRESKTDPRMDPYIYGDGGILKELQSWYQANKGPNANQTAGWNTQLGLLQDPAINSQLQQMRGNAFGQANAQVAGNPFTSGAASLMNQWKPKYGGGLLGG